MSLSKAPALVSPQLSSELFRALLDQYWKGKISGEQFALLGMYSSPPPTESKSELTIREVSDSAHCESIPCSCSASFAPSSSSIAESQPSLFTSNSISLGYWKTVEALSGASEATGLEVRVTPFSFPFSSSFPTSASPLSGKRPPVFRPGRLTSIAEEM